MFKNAIVTTYEPDNAIKKGLFCLINEIIVEIKSSRWLTYQLFLRSFFSMYKQSFLGIFWIILLPVVNVAVFAVLNNAGVFNIGEIQMPYPIYAITGITFWQIFAVGLGSSANALVSAGDMVTKINCSKKSLVIAPMGRTLVSLLIQLVLVGVLFLFYGTVPKLSIFLIPIVVVPIIFLTLGLGFLVAIINAIMRDIGNILSLGITFLMYLTPVLYAKPKIGILSHITKYNPMYHFVSTGRDLMFSGYIRDMKGFLFATFFSLVLFISALVIFHLTETRIAERI